MATPGSVLQVAKSQGQYLTDAATNDVVFRTDTSNQRLLLAAGSNVAAAVAVASNAVRFAKDVFVDSGRLDVAAGSNLSIGSNAAVINIGSATATVNILGAVNQVTATQTTIADPLLTLNKGGAAASGAGVGVEVEEGGAATAYVKTDATRAQWQLKAPGTAGVAAIVPGTDGITLDQSSHDPVTLGAAASNGLSLSGQVLSLGVASITAPGALAAADFASFSNKVDASLMRQIGSNIGVNAHIVPASNVTFDLGSADYRFRDLYLSGNTINLGGTKISTDTTTGDIKLVDAASSGLKRLVVDELQIGDETVDAEVFKITRSNGKVKIQQSNAASGVMADSNTVIDNLFSMSNRIGIGKSNPAFSLDVAGDVNFSGILRSNGAAYISSQWTTSNAAIYLVGSNVAIGKSNAVYPLDVVGDINFTGILRSNGAAYVSSQFTASNGVVFLPSGSNLGLGGKSNPAYTLDVTGGVNVSDGFYINGVPFTGGAGGGSGTIVTSAGIQSVAADQVLAATQLQQITASNAAAGLGLGSRGAVSVAASNATMLIAGAAAYGGNSTGTAVFYYRATGATGTWTELQRVFGSGASNALGTAVAMSPDGTAAAVASATQVLVYTVSGSGASAVWSQAGSALAVAGATSLALSAVDGSSKYYLIAGQSASDQAVVYYGGAGATWTQQGSALTGTASTLFGADVAITADGVHALVGAPAAANGDTGIQNTGAAVFYKRTGTSWASVVTVAGEANGDQYGSAVAISGTVAAVGAPKATHSLGIQTGAVYPFNYDGTTWALQGSGKLVGGEATSGDQMGGSVSLDPSGTYIVAGSVYDTTAGGVAAGSASLFLRSGNNWSFVSTITAKNSAVNTGFGQRVALAQTAAGSAYVLVAAPAATTNVSGTGALYWFALAATPYQWNSASGLASVAPAASRVQLGSNLAVVVDAANSRLGIGKSNPAYALDVTGDVNFTGILRSNGAAYVSSQFTTASNGVYIAGGSNVAIGTATVSASRALYVAGDIEATGKLYAGSSFAALSNLPTASSYPGMTAFVAATGLLYVSDGSQWVAQAAQSSLTSAAGAAVAKSGDTMTGDLAFATGKGIDSTGVLNVGVSNATTLNLGTSAATTTINLGTGAGATTINIGAAGDTVNVAGTLAYVNTTNLQVTDKLVTLNKGGAASSGFTTGLEIEENATTTGYVRTDGSGATWQLKAPAAAGVVTLDAGSAGFTVSAGTMWAAGMSNGTVYRLSNVGIGKSNPAWALDVVGDVNFTGALRSNGALYVSSQFSTSNTSNVFLASGSNLGIGKSSNILYPLDVAGDINFSGILRSNGAAYVGSQFTTATSNVFLSAGSNLGLGGQSNPAYALDVAGDVNVTGAFRINGASAALPLGALPRRNYVRTGFAGASAAGSYGVTYSTLASNNSMAGVYINYTTSATAGDSFTVLADGMYSIVAQGANDGAYANMWIDRNLASNLGYADAGAAGNILALSSKGNTPECSVAYTGYLNSNDVIRVKLAASMGADVATSWASVTITYLGAASYFSQNGSRVFIAAGSNLGVGTSTPAWALDVAGDINLTGQLRSNGAPYVSSQFSVASTSNVFLAAGSNLGLGGKSNPAYALDVTGDVNVSGAFRINGSNATLPLGTLPRRNYIRTGFAGANSYAVAYTTLSADNSMAGVYVNYTANSNAGDSFTILADGMYSIVAQGANNGPYANMWIDRNLASNVAYSDAGAAGNILALASKGNMPECAVTYTGYLSSNDVIRVKLAASSGQNVATSWASITITFMGAASFFSQSGTNVFIAAGSNLGIGTSAPSAPLHAYGSALQGAAGSISELARASTSILGYNEAYIRQYARRITTGTDWTTTALRIQARVDVTDMGYLEFNPSNANYGIALGNGSNEYMRVVPTGTGTSANFGINTTAPRAALDIQSPGNTTLIIASSNGSNTSFGIQAFDTSLSLGSYAGGGNINRQMTIGSGGGVGIGTTATSASLLTLYGTTGSYMRILTSLNSGQAIDFKAVSTSGTTGCFTFDTGSSSAEWRSISFMNANVGVGTTSPAAIFDVYGPISNRGGTGGTVGYINLQQGGATNTGHIEFRNADTSRMGYIGYGASDVFYVMIEQARHLLFATSGIERMRTTSDGNLLIGTTANTNLGKVVIEHNSAADNGLVIRDTRTSGSSRQMLFVYNGTEVGNITTSSTSTSYVTSSDYRLKENVQPMTNAVSRVMQLKPVTYTWKSDGSAGEGFIAHELQTVAPLAVTGEKDAVDAQGNPLYQGIDTSFLVATLTAAIQEQQAVIQSQAQKIDALSAFIAAKFPGEFAA